MKFNILIVWKRSSIVAPFAGAWIEIKVKGHDGNSLKSLPSRERGLKFQKSYIPVHMTIVAPFAGAWIEILKPTYGKYMITVAPFAGAWIEIPITPIFFFSLIRRSLRGSVD